MAWYQSPIIMHPHAGCAWDVFWRKYRENGPYDQRGLLSRAFAIGANIARRPASALERRRHAAAIDALELEHPPVFLIGHWRSGTTHLHNILNEDPRFACITFAQSAAPLEYLGRFQPARHVMRLLLPKTRGMDAVVIGPDTPQEEEMALGNVTPFSFYNCFYFPPQWERHFRQSLFREELDPKDAEDLAAGFRYLVQKVAYSNPGRQVLFKNPANTTRIEMIRELYPDARFIHIVRDPYDVFASSLKLWPRMFEGFAWSSWRSVDIELVILTVYRRVMESLAGTLDAGILPEGAFSEIRYEDLVDDPISAVRSALDGIRMPLDSRTEQRFHEYIESLGVFPRRSPALNDRIIARINEHWGFAFERWNYPMIDGAGS